MLRGRAHAPAAALLLLFVAATLSATFYQSRPLAAQASTGSSFPAVPFPFNSVRTEQEMAFADDGTFVWCSAKAETAVAAGDELDIYIAKYDEATKSFSEPVNMGLAVNSAPDPDEPLRNGMDIEPWISPDGQRLYFRSNRLADSEACTEANGKPCAPDTHWGGFASTKLFKSTKAADGTWSTPEPLPFPINSEYGEHCPMERRDGRSLCFASARPGGYGGDDIWCAAINDDGTYGDAVNMGAEINSAGMESHFHEHPTEGHVSFVSTREDDWGDIWTAKPDGAGGWLPPTRLKINTHGEQEACPAFTPSGKLMYYFSTKNMPGSEPETMDIFVVANPVE